MAMSISSESDDDRWHSSGTESTEQPDDEELTRQEIKCWLDAHGAKLFGLEASKFLAQEQRRKNLATQRK